MWVAGALRGSPAATTRTLRRARASTKAADRPAAPPPMTTTSNWLMSPGWSRTRCSSTNVAECGKRESDEPVEDATAAAIAAALDQVAARLQRIRTQRGLTLTAVAEAIGISKSTMSRLETGHRRPTLDLLLALSHLYRVPLDDLVAAPEEGDPRIHLQPGRVQAWKIVVPTSNATPELRAHDGHEWIYVLSGRLRLVLGGQDRVLGPGEIASFDTTEPHWFGSTGAEPAEILSIFNRPGERTTTPLSGEDRDRAPIRPGA